MYERERSGRAASGEKERERGRMNCTVKEKGIRSGKRIHRRIETHGAENQFDIGVDPYSRNVKYLSCRILSGEQTIRVIAGAVGYFYFPTAPTSLYSLAIRRNYTGTCHEESQLGSHGAFCGLL